MVKAALSDDMRRHGLPAGLEPGLRSAAMAVSPAADVQ